LNRFAASCSHSGKTNLTDLVIVNLDTMSDNSKFLAGIIAGAAAGAAITLLLNTESGKKVLADLKAAAGKTLQNLQNAAAGYAEEAETVV
jgi:hypothetical protein